VIRYVQLSFLKSSFSSVLSKVFGGPWHHPLSSLSTRSPQSLHVRVVKHGLCCSDPFVLDTLANSVLNDCLVLRHVPCSRRFWHRSSSSQLGGGAHCRRRKSHVHQNNSTGTASSRRSRGRGTCTAGRRIVVGRDTGSGKSRCERRPGL
jgi:hypothetical protein